jgi:hypothetical protein
MDPIATYIVERIRQNNALEEAEQAQEKPSTLQSAVSTLRKLGAFVGQKTHSIAQPSSKDLLYEGKEYNGFDLRPSKQQRDS